jgi:hypothetical protein
MFLLPIAREQYYGVETRQAKGVFSGARVPYIIPMLVDNDSFDRVPLIARQERFAPWCCSPQAERDAASGQGNLASGGARQPSGCVAALARCRDIVAHGPRLPGGLPRSIKWVIISEHWY